MKKTLSLLLLAAVLTTACSKQSHGADDIVTQQKNNGAEDNPAGGGGSNVSSVPPAVIAAFAARYPDARSVQWKVLNNGNYKAEFFRGAVKWQATFTSSGVLVKEEHN